MWPDGAHFEGKYVSGLKVGHGRLVFADKSVYEGEFKNNEISGFGIY